MRKKTIKELTETKVVFHISQSEDGKPGKYSFLGEFSILQLENILSPFWFERNRSWETGRICKAFYTNGGDSIIGLVGSGYYDFDGEFNTYYVKDYRYLTNFELSIISEANKNILSDKLKQIISFYEEREKRRNTGIGTNKRST